MTWNRRDRGRPYVEPAGPVPAPVVAYLIRVLEGVVDPVSVQVLRCLGPEAESAGFGYQRGLTDDAIE